MPELQRPGASIHYEIHGQGEALVLIAGFSADHTVWQNIVDLLARSFQVILLDNRGAGRSSCADMKGGTTSGSPLSIGMMSDDVIALLDELEIPSAHFMGNSMGGAIVQDLACRYPRRMRSIIISNSFMKPHARLRLMLEAGFELRKAGAPLVAMAKVALAEVYSLRFIQSVDANAFVEMALAHPHPFSIEAFELQMQALLAFDSEPWIRQIQCPALVIASGDDLLADPAEALRMAQSIRGAKYTCFEDLGHLPHIEDPEAFQRMVLEFLMED
jgi:pimeloyl-ACP methyl ester carboxylesterase